MFVTKPTQKEAIKSTFLTYLHKLDWTKKLANIQHSIQCEKILGKNQPISGKSSQNIYTKLQFESPKPLNQSTFEIQLYLLLQIIL
jgi:hypothetical protein